MQQQNNPWAQKVLAIYFLKALLVISETTKI